MRPASQFFIGKKRLLLLGPRIASESAVEGSTRALDPDLDHLPALLSFEGLRGRLVPHADVLHLAHFHALLYRFIDVICLVEHFALGAAVNLKSHVATGGAN